MVPASKNPLRLTSFAISVLVEVPDKADSESKPCRENIFNRSVINIRLLNHRERIPRLPRGSSIKF